MCAWPILHAARRCHRGTKWASNQRPSQRGTLLITTLPQCLRVCAQILGHFSMKTCLLRFKNKHRLCWSLFRTSNMEQGTTTAGVGFATLHTQIHFTRPRYSVKRKAFYFNMKALAVRFPEVIQPERCENRPSPNHLYDILKCMKGSLGISVDDRDKEVTNYLLLWCTDP